VVQFTIGSRGEVPEKKEPVITEETAMTTMTMMKKPLKQYYRVTH
jgi:hypothetical protein